MALTQVPIELSSTPGIVDNSNATAITIDASGNVGIGTTSPFFTTSGRTSLSVNGSTSSILAFGKGGSSENYILADAGGLTIANTSTTLPTVFFNNGAERLRIDSSGRLLVGTTSANYASVDLTVGNTADSQNGIAIQTSTTGYGYVLFGDGIGASAYRGQIYYKHGDDFMAMHTAGSERMRIDSSGNVDITIGNLFTDTTSGIFFSGGIGGFTNGIYGVGVNNVAINAGGSERMRINSAGDWMVSNTVANVASNYSAQEGCGWVDSDHHFEIATTSNRSALEIGKNNANDGAIITFRKQSSPVGSIGTGSGLLTIGKGTGNLVFENALVAPCSDASAGSSNGVVDLGTSARRFKDLYLSGGVYLGGTGSANKLDDYEEGTFTASLGGTTGEPSTLITADVAKYTKVGNKVHFEISFENESTTGYSGGILIRGLPFTSGGGRTVCSAAHYKSTTWDAGKIPIAIMNSTSTQIEFLNIISGSAWEVALHNTAGTARYIWVTGTYKIT